MLPGDYILPKREPPPKPEHLVVVAANFVSPDEPAYQLAEIVRTPPTGGGLHRYQYILVTRNDRWAEFVQDLGPTLWTLADQFCILSLWEHSVGELRDMALEMRHNRGRVQDEIEPRDLVGDWVLWLDEKTRRRGHRSTFGPLGRVVRS